MNFLEALDKLSAKLWDRRRALPGTAEAQQVLDTLAGEERTYLRYVLATVPAGDITEYGAGFFLKLLRQALAARRDFGWCAALPERDFLLYVLYPRINDEELSDCRELFRQALEPRVRGRSLGAAILEVNRWCAEQVTYRSTDERTASVLDVYRRGFGRCGEESAFAVTALRSVGICARQVYCPWWSHCDDNHAWVEAFDGKDWRYFGACEPEPTLDRGWFTQAASRAMLIHTRTFLPEDGEAEALLFPEAAEEDRFTVDGVRFSLRTARYAETRPVTVTVLSETGQPVPNARVIFSVLNMGGYLPIGEKTTGAAGKVSLRLGSGDVKITCFTDNKCSGEGLFSTVKDDNFTLRLTQEADTERDFLFSAPTGNGAFPLPLAKEAKALRRVQLAQAAACRAARPKIECPALSAKQARIFAALPEKDRAGGPDPAVLADGEAAFRFEAGLPAQVFEEAMLSPRIGKEPLRPWRRAVQAALGEGLCAEFAQQPEMAWPWVQAHFVPLSGRFAPAASPVATLALGAGSEASLDILLCAALRCAGVAARLSPDTGEPEFWRAGAYRPAKDTGPRGQLTVQAPDRPVTVSRVEEHEKVLFTVPAGQETELRLPPGRYRLLTATRLPSGDQLAREQTCTLAAGQERSVTLKGREAAPEDLLTRYPLPPFSLGTEAGKWISSREAVDGKALVCWLEPGREPTEHLLGELAAAGEKIACPVHFVVPDRAAQDDPTLRRAMAALPDARLWLGDFQDAAEELARRVFTEPGRLPLSLLCDGPETCAYSCAGYNVGAAELIASVLNVL